MPQDIHGSYSNKSGLPKATSRDQPRSVFALPDGRLATNIRGLPFFALGTLAYSVVLRRASAARSQPWDLALLAIACLAFVLALHFWRNTATRLDIHLRWYDFLLLSSLVSLTVLLHSLDLSHWSFGFIGDELAFFQHAKHIASGQSWNPFDLSGVYNCHPMLDSAYQALFLRFFGTNIFGWRFAEVWLAGISVGLLYVLARMLYGHFAALSCGLVLASSHYLMAFCRIGNNNPHCIPFSLVAFLLATLAVRSGRLTLLFLTGVSLGLCVYTFMAAWLTGPICVLFLLTLLRRKNLAGQLLSLLWLAAGVLFAVAPALLCNSTGDIAQEVAFQTRREMAAEKPWLVSISSLRHSLGIFWFNRSWFSHYIGGPLLDRISGLFLLIGLGVSAINFRRPAFRLAMLWFVVGLVAIGASNYRPEPSITRLLYLLPSASLLAGIGSLRVRTALMSWLQDDKKWLVVVGATLVFPAIFVLNLRQLFLRNPTRTQPNHVIITLKVLQENPSKNLVDVSDGPPDFNLHSMIGLYPGYLERYHFTDLDELQTYGLDKMPPNDTLYLARTPSVAWHVGRRLGDRFDTVVDENVTGTFRIWLFVPRGPAPSTESASL